MNKDEEKAYLKQIGAIRKSTEKAFKPYDVTAILDKGNLVLKGSRADAREAKLSRRMTKLKEIFQSMGIPVSVTSEPIRELSVKIDNIGDLRKFEIALKKLKNKNRLSKIKDMLLKKEEQQKKEKEKEKKNKDKNTISRFYYALFGR